MRFLLAFLLLSGTAFADHDCRIKGIDIRVTRQNIDGQSGHRVAISYIGSDGALLSPLLCPDQIAPTVGTDAGLLIQQDERSYVYWVEDPGPGVYNFDAATYQDWFKPRAILGHKRIRFY